MIRKDVGFFPNSKLLRVVFPLSFCSLLLSSPSFADSGQLHDVVVRSIEYNPEVQAAWHTFKASGYEVQQAKAGYLPSVDVSLTGGKQSRDFDGRGTYNTTQGQISVAENLFNGFRNQGQIEHFEGGQRVRFFELLGVVESTALEATKAFEDLSRERLLVELAKSNYTKHQEVYAQIEERTLSGVGRKVDLEQVAGRLALAESNLLVEASNLHDVTARYLRVVGSLPAKELIPSNLEKSTLPDSIKSALQLAYSGNPNFKAAVHNIAATQANVKIERSGYYPKAEIRARQLADRNSNGFDERVDAHRYGQESAVELALTYNLYSGGATRSGVRRALEEVNVAKDLRDKACVDLRQNTQIAFNDSQRIKEQLVALDQHKRSSDKVRVAYYEQFKIGQRSLLDLLDAENEYFQASRAYVTAEADLKIAHAKTLAEMGALLPELKITRESLAQTKDFKVSDKLSSNTGSACPLDVEEGLARKDLISELVRLSGDALFDVNSSVLTSLASQKLDLLVSQIKATPDVVEIKIAGHTDNSGSDMINIPLSKARAESVKNYLILNGLEKITYFTEGYGATKPVADNSNDAGKAANRRVEITISRRP